MDVKTSPPATSVKYLLFLLLLLTIGFRIVQMDADPPADFSWSGGYFADEGFWSHNARNAVLFGNPVRDEWDARIVSPIFAFLQQLILSVFGVGLTQVRLIGLFSAAIIAVASFFIFRKQWSAEISFLFSLLVSLNFPMLVLARQGILDPFAAAMAWVALALLLSENPAAVFFAGVLAVASCVTKYLMIYSFVPLIASLIYSKRRIAAVPAAREGGRDPRGTMLFFAGTILAGLIWLFLDYIPNHELLLSYSRYYSSQQSWQPLAVLRNVALQPFYLYFVKTPAILLFGNLMLWYFLSQPRESKDLQRICWIWLFSGILFFALWRYRPLRYYTSLLLPLSALAGIAILRMEELSQAIKAKPLLWIGIAIPFAQVTFVLLDRWLHWRFIPEQVGIHSFDAILFLMLTAAIVFIAFFVAEKRKWAVILFFLAFVLSDVRNYLDWMLNPNYAAVEISHDLQERVGNGVLTGQWGPELCLENHVRTVPVWYGFVNSNEPFAKYHITHVLVWRYALGGEQFEEWYPVDFKNFHPVVQYKIKDSDLVLYEIESGS